jgi:predicted nucleic acid-binding protein
LEQAKRVFLDTAPLIYYVEKDERYLAAIDLVFDRIDAGELTTVTSAVTLAECLVLPYRNNQPQLVESFFSRIVGGRHTVFMPISQDIAREAASLQAQYNLTLDDAFQLATCVVAGCDLFLTNDRELTRVNKVDVLLLSEMKPADG